MTTCRIDQVRRTPLREGEGMGSGGLSTSGHLAVFLLFALWVAGVVLAFGSTARGFGAGSPEGPSASRTSLRPGVRAPAEGSGRGEDQTCNVQIRAVSGPEPGFVGR